MALGPSPLAANDAEALDEERREYMSSKQYERQCRQIRKKFPDVQSENAERGEEPKLLCRMPPSFPDSCQSTANRRQSVDLVYDVTADGYTTNIRLSKTDNECFVSAAVRSLMLWRYEASENGATDLETTIVFEFVG